MSERDEMTERARAFLRSDQNLLNQPAYNPSNPEHVYAAKVRAMAAFAESETASLRRELKEARAEIERLTKALRRIAKFRRATIHAYGHCRAVAREALTPPASVSVTRSKE